MTPRDATPGRRAVLLAAGGLALAVSAVFGVAFAVQGASLAAAAAKHLIDYDRVGGFGFGADLVRTWPSATVQMFWTFPSTSLPFVALYGALRPWLDTPTVTLLARALQIALFEASVPLFAATLLARGVRARPALLATLLYGLGPVCLSELSWAILVPAAPFQVLAWWAASRGHGRTAVAGLLLAAGCHPLVGFGTLLSTGTVFGEGLPRARRWARGLLGGMIAAQVVGLAIPLLRSPHEPSLVTLAVVGVQRASVLASFLSGDAAGALQLLARNALQIAVLLGTGVGVLLFGAPRALGVVALDLAYYLNSGDGVHHGLLPSTVGLLAVLGGERLARFGPADAARSVRALALAAALAAAVYPWWDSRLAPLQAVRHPAPPPFAADVARALDGAVPAGARVVVQPTLLPVFEGRAAYVEPWSVQAVERADLALWLAPGRLDPDHADWLASFEVELCQWELDDRVFLGLARRLRQGSLHAAAVGDLLVRLAPGKVSDPGLDAALAGRLQAVADRISADRSFCSR